MMISRRNFAMITAIMLVILFMFQSTGIAKKHLNDAHTNEYALENQTAMRSQDAYSPDVKRMRILNGESGAPGAGKGETEGEETTSNKRLVLFLGDGSSKVYHTVRQWCTYSKRALLSVRHASDPPCYESRSLQAFDSPGIAASIHAPACQPILNGTAAPHSAS